MILLLNNISELYEEAIKALEYAYTPYSHFKVGAAVLDNEGHIYTGCNIENGSYGACMCAERVAIYKAISSGAKVLTDIAVVCSEDRQAIPCGLCLQVMSELMPNAKVHLKDNTATYSYGLSELLPIQFKL